MKKNFRWGKRRLCIQKLRSNDVDLEALVAGDLFIHCYELFINPFPSLLLDWATTTGRLLGPVTYRHKDGGIPLNVLSKDTTSEHAGLFFTLPLSC